MVDVARGIALKNCGSSIRLGSRARAFIRFISNTLKRITITNDFSKKPRVSPVINEIREGGEGEEGGFGIYR